MLSVTELAPVAFELTFRSFGRSERMGRVVAQLLREYGEFLSDLHGVTAETPVMSIGDEFQMFFPERGILHVTEFTAAFSAEYPGDSRPSDSWIPERLEWALTLLEDVMRIQKKRTDAVVFQIVWLFWGEHTYTRLRRHRGHRGAARPIEQHRGWQ